MRNPWLDIPADDYAAHMGSAAVGQTAVLSRLTREALDVARPGRVLYLGASSGNGLEHVDAAVTRRVVCVDINADYLARLARAYAGAPFAIETVCADVATLPFEPEAFDLAHAALLFEYIDWQALVPRLAAALAPAGTLSVVLQRPSSSGAPAVTPSPYTSLRLLEPLFTFVDVDALDALADRAGLDVSAARDEQLTFGKVFAVRRYVKRGNVKGNLR